MNPIILCLHGLHSKGTSDVWHQSFSRQQHVPSAKTNYLTLVLASATFLRDGPDVDGLKFHMLGASCRSLDDGGGTIF